MTRDRHPGYDCEPLKEPWLSRSEALIDACGTHADCTGTGPDCSDPASEPGGEA